MPKKLARAVRAIQRRFRRRRRRIKKLPPVGMPAKKLVRLRYCDEIRLDPVAGGIATYNFSANGMYDPDITAVLGQNSKIKTKKLLPLCSHFNTYKIDPIF